MDTKELRRAVHDLKKRQTRKRSTAITLSIGGIVLIAMGGWGQYLAASQIRKIIEAFYDSPSIAIGLVSAVNPTMTIGRLTVFFGIGLLLFGIIRFFYPDPTRTVLLALLERSDLEVDDEPETRT